MKLIIQIPCYNEEQTLPQTLTDLPKSIPGIDVIETQIIDDGSTDKTQQIAKNLGVNHIVSFRGNRGLAAAFKAGIDNAMLNDADILVNTDGDNQYCGQDIQKLVQPILSGEADLVIGCRPIENHPEFSPLKKMLQKLGSWVLRKVSNTMVKDAASGFRAYSRNALLHMNIYSDFSYCIETLIHAGLVNLKISSVDIRINPKTRDSRLFGSIFEYIWKQTKTMVIVFLLYRANWFFNTIAVITGLISFIFAVRYVVLIMTRHAPAGAFWPSIVLSGVLLVVAILVYLVGVIASLISSLRKLGEDINYRLKKMEIKKQL